MGPNQTHEGTCTLLFRRLQRRTKTSSQHSWFSISIIYAVQPIRFALSVLSYLALPDWFLFVFTTFFPYAMIALGIALALSRKLSVYVLAGVVFALFSVAQGMALATGKIQDCGCFGYFSDQISWKTVSIPLVMMLISFVCCYAAKREAIVQAS
jgi:hypothetical protein